MTRREATVILIAKEPRPGHVKTRLCPPCTPEGAAAIAHAALGDTVGAICDSRATRVVVALDGVPGRWVPTVAEVVPQVSGGLGERLQAAFDHVAGTAADPLGSAAMVIGMDTPQVSAALIDEVLEVVESGTSDAVLGRALDGGYWTIGFSGPVLREHCGREGAGSAGFFSGVSMSTDSTAEEQLQRLAALSLSCAEVGSLRDIDTWNDALVVAREHPDLAASAAIASADVGSHATDGNAG